MSEEDEVVEEASHPYVLIVDSRDPSRPPLSHILDNVARMGCEPVVAWSMEGALLAVSERLPRVALVHLGADPRPAGGGGANVATELRRRAQQLPVVLYTGRPSAWDDRGLAALRRSIALAHETKVVAPADNLVAVAARLATAFARLSADFAGAPPAAAPPVFPDDHYVQSFLTEVERAFIVVALQCRSTGQLAAEALGLAPRTLERRIHDLDIRARSGPPAMERPTRPVLLHVAGQPPPAATVRAASRAAMEVLGLPPGCLSARDLAEPWLGAAVVHVVDVAAVVDAWKLARAHPVVPWAAWGTPSLPVALLMDEIGLDRPRSLASLDEDRHRPRRRRPRDFADPVRGRSWGGAWLRAPRRASQPTRPPAAPPRQDRARRLRRRGHHGWRRAPRAPRGGDLHLLVQAREEAAGRAPGTTRKR